nr:ras suppressor protein 1 isoform X1 [Columba livia]
MSKSLKKTVEESREKNQPEVDMCDRGISNMLDVPGLFTLSHITQLVLSHNKLTTVPANIADLRNIEVLNFFNNQIEELPTQISSLQKLKHLNLGMNRLNTLPRGFGSLPALEVLDLTYNNLNENSLPGNFFYLTTLRALYLSDNDFEILPPDIGKLTKLQILSLRDNDLISLPKEIGELTQLKELHIQGNRLTVLPPELGNLDLTGQKQVFKAENNPWVTPIADQFQLGVSHVFEYIRSETYKYGIPCNLVPSSYPKQNTERMQNQVCFFNDEKYSTDFIRLKVSKDIFSYSRIFIK